MRKQAFTLSELLVGLVIGLLLTTAMMSFTSSIVFDFHNQRDIVNDRSVLKQIMNGLSEDLVQVGYEADANGQVTINNALEDFVTIEEGDVGDRLVYWVPTASIDDITSARPGMDLGWQEVIWERQLLLDPIFNIRLPCLVRIIRDENGAELSNEPVLTHVRNFVPEVGLTDGTFTSTPADYSTVNSIRIYINTSTPTNEGDSAYTGVEQESTQTYFLRSRSI